MRNVKAPLKKTEEQKFARDPGIVPIRSHMQVHDGSEAGHVQISIEQTELFVQRGAQCITPRVEFPERFRSEHLGKAC
jgi:hypothetical protein